MKIYRTTILVALSLFMISLPRCSSCSSCAGNGTTLQTKAKITTTAPAETTTEATTAEPTTVPTTEAPATEATTTDAVYLEEETTTETPTTTEAEPQGILDEPREEYKIYGIRYEMAASWDYAEQAENRQVFTIKEEGDSLSEMAFCHVLVNAYTEGSAFPDADEAEREATAEQFCTEFKDVNNLRITDKQQIEVLGDTAYAYTLYFEEEASDLPLYFVVIYLPEGALNIAFYYPDLEIGSALYEELLDSLVAEVDVIDLDVLVQDDEPANDETDGDEITVEEEESEENDGDAQGNSHEIPEQYLPAFEVADSYLNATNPSKRGLYDLLVSEAHGFSPDAAQYVVDHLEVDWNFFALQRAKHYANDQYMSKLAIYDMLIADYGDKFTQEEARYAVENVDADWNDNALQIALSYKNDLNMEPDKIYEQLISEYGERFTPEEAQYAIDNLP